jgi:OmpA-OmpF porin, OOP family
MIKFALSSLCGPLLLLVIMGHVSHALAADEVDLQPSQEIEQLKQRADKLSYDALDPRSYSLAKARTWLDLATSEYYDRDDSGIVAASIAQAAALLDALETKRTGIAIDMPAKVPGSETIRPELWDKIAALKKQSKFSCGQRQTAEAEVYLVWAGHEFAESGQSHAESYLRGAESRIYEAQTAIDQCMETAPTPVMEKFTLSGDALFDFGKVSLNPSALWRLDELAGNIKKVENLEEVVLVGHTDRLRSDGHPERNQLLSEQRAESIKQYLVGKGIPADKIRASGAGSSQPVVECSAKLSKARQVVCLQPNRRVEITLRGKKAPAAKTDGDDKGSGN